MCISVLRGASGLEWLVGILHINEDRASATGVVAARASTAANYRKGLERMRSVPKGSEHCTSNCIAQLLVCNNVMRATRDAVGDVHPANVLRSNRCIERLGVLGRQLEQLLHVEELDAVANSLRADDQSISDLFDLTPDDTFVCD